jgi:hypothetical protein
MKPRTLPAAALGPSTCRGCRISRASAADTSPSSKDATALLRRDVQAEHTRIDRAAMAPTQEARTALAMQTHLRPRCAWLRQDATEQTPAHRAEEPSPMTCMQRPGTHRPDERISMLRATKARRAAPGGSKNALCTLRCSRDARSQLIANAMLRKHARCFDVIAGPTARAQRVHHGRNGQPCRMGERHRFER